MVGRMTYNSRFMLAFFAGLSIGVTISLVIQYATQDYAVFETFKSRREQTDREENTSPPPEAPTVESHEPELSDVPPHWAAPPEGTTDGEPAMANSNSTSNGTGDILHYLRRNRTAAEAHQGEDHLVEAMFEKIRILCWIMTQPSNHKIRAMTVLQTWGKRCNILYFVSTSQVENETTVIFPGNESRSILWGKTKLGFKYAYEHHFDDADWFLKADDDTYLIMENMRLLLLDKDPATPVHYGCKYKVIVPQGYMSGGAGYVLSKEALRLFVEDGLPNNTRCRQDDDGAEDAEIGICLQNVGVAAGDSRDQEGKQRFFPFIPQDLVPPGKVDMSFWYWTNIFYMHEPGINCCSDSVIGFHYIDVNLMWTLEYLIYHVHPFGRHPQLTGSKVYDDIVRYLTHPNVTAVTKKQQVAATTQTKLAKP